MYVFGLNIFYFKRNRLPTSTKLTSGFPLMYVFVCVRVPRIPLLWNNLKTKLIDFIGRSPGYLNWDGVGEILVDRNLDISNSRFR